MDSNKLSKNPRFEMLRKEYLNQTFNFMPALRVAYDKVGPLKKPLAYLAIRL